MWLQTLSLLVFLVLRIESKYKTETGSIALDTAAPESYGGKITTSLPKNHFLKDPGGCIHKHMVIAGL